MMCCARQSRSADARVAAVQRPFFDGFLRGAALQHFEAVAGGEQARERFVVAVVGAADALHQARAQPFGAPI